jgi:hypothetical protein
MNAKPVSAYIIGNREARSKAIKNVAIEACKKIDYQIRTRVTSVEEDVYVLHFVGFNSEQRGKIESSLADLEEGKKPYLKVKTSSSAGTAQFTVEVKWIRSRDSQSKVTRVIKDTCEDNEVYVECNKSSKGVMYFQPGKADEEDYE